MKRLGRKFAAFSRAAWSSCPYTILYKKTVRCQRHMEPNETGPVSDTANKIIMKIKMGRNIALIGVFCPFFWMALFAGARGQVLYFNAIHSGAVIAIGLVIIATYGMRL
ncbi:MAG: hypothetical protein PHT96_12120 [Syntrophorhabdaceae bacterium]|nr:hypothetical protein [Syntrophorhabdaceae bacterium]